MTGPDKPTLVTDGRYTFAHGSWGIAGPFTPVLDDEGQVADVEANRNDPHGLPFNPRECVGGRVHTVENVMAPPDVEATS